MEFLLLEGTEPQLELIAATPSTQFVWPMLIGGLIGIAAVIWLLKKFVLNKK